MDSNSAAIYAGEIVDVAENPLLGDKEKAEVKDSATNIEEGQLILWRLLMIVCPFQHVLLWELTRN